MTGRFTGRHMAAIMLAFFGVVFTVNMIMASFAWRTFSGTVVDNSYVAGQQFNRWLAEARAQQAELGWTAEASRDRDGHVLLRVGSPSGPLGDATVFGVAAHPIGRAAERTLAFEPAGDSVHRSTEALPEGRWALRLTVERLGQRGLFVADLRP